ncbi:60S ribosomal protein L6-like [Stylophora pistillata]|uniref:Large ribosomal subunit protein eL6 n=1 Tax=Stylophora pistillata TaxID=50429 RepID=A0A2B4S5U2_STYPI|nr:60S ribosomal protein L6-like [Stylophora pistillata]PFX23892.1 60S ribosomal protein L6 [Stylophora pistillata]
MAKVHTPRNKDLAPGIGRYSRSAIYKKRALYKRKKTGVKKEVVEEPKTRVKEVGGDKNGSTRVVPVKRESRYYPTEDVRRPLRNRRKAKPTKLRTSITPGTILILLAGRHRGKRVVFLKQLASGLLLVTGPYKVNGVPLRRVNQAYVIATSTQIDLSNFKLPERLSDDFFKREPRKKKRTEDMFEDAQEERKPSEERIEDQKTVDEQILPEISKEAHLKKYLKTLFSLRKGQYPHSMKF